MNSTNQEAKLKTLPGPWSLGEMTGNWRDIDLPDHGGVMRIVWKMEDDEGRNEALEAQAHAVVAALNAASHTPMAGQQVIIDFAQVGTAGPFPVVNGHVKLPDATMQDLARMLRPTYEAEQQAALKAAPGEPTAISEAIKRMAADRYKVVPSHGSVFYSWAVVAGSGTQQLMLGRKADCQNVARKLTGAFLDGALVAMQQAAPQQEPIGWTTGITWRQNSRLQSEQVIKITRDAQPNYGYTTPIYTAPQPAPDGGSCTDGNTPGLMPADAELLAHIKEAVPGLTRVNTALMVAKAVLEKFGSRRVASEVK